MSVPGIDTLSSRPIDPYPTTPRGYSVSTACPDDLATIYQTVRATGQHNFVAARIPVPHGLNMAAWRHYAHCHNDPELSQFLEYGFPISYMLPLMPLPAASNHGSATRFPSHVDHYITTELQYRTLCGPFHAPPFHPFQTSALMTAPKKDSDKRRVILDLSFPQGFSVNSGIPRDSYLSSPYKLHLPSAQDLRHQITKTGQGCLLWSVDLKRSYRQLRVCPLDWPLLGFQWRGQFYFDTAVPFGIRWGAMFMQRTTEAASSIAAHEGISVIPYIDDLACAQKPHEAHGGMVRFKQLLTELGLEDEPRKENLPRTQMTWVGIRFDTVAMTMSIPQEKIAACLHLTAWWASRSHCTRSQLRRYLGKLFHLCQCCPTLRLFVNRMLDTFRAAPEHGTVPLDQSFQADIKWILSFLPTYNGIQMIPASPTLSVPVTVDSCLSGCGGHFGDHIFHTPFPYFVIRDSHHISHLEMLTVVLAIKLWAPHLAGHVVRLQCDNAAAVSVLQSGRGRDPYLLACARTIWTYTAHFHFEIQVEHLPGVQNQLADQLSRYQIDASCRAQVDNYISEQQPIVHIIHDEMFVICDNWSFSIRICSLDNYYADSNSDYYCDYFIIILIMLMFTIMIIIIIIIVIIILLFVIFIMMMIVIIFFLLSVSYYYFHFIMTLSYWYIQ